MTWGFCLANNLIYLDLPQEETLRKPNEIATENHWKGPGGGWFLWLVTEVENLDEEAKKGLEGLGEKPISRGCGVLGRAEEGLLLAFVGSFTWRTSGDDFVHLGLALKGIMWHVFDGVYWAIASLLFSFLSLLGKDIFISHLTKIWFWKGQLALPGVLYGGLLRSPFLDPRNPTHYSQISQNKLAFGTAFFAAQVMETGKTKSKRLYPNNNRLSCDLKTSHSKT